jgi:hypothetical protein
MCLAFLALSAASAQEKKTVPPPPKPADEGQSLEVTMKFIQDKLNDFGPVIFANYLHDDATGNNWTNRAKLEVTRVVADPAVCRVSYHWKTEFNGAVQQDIDISFLLKQVSEIDAMTMDDKNKQTNTALGHPTWSSRSDPPVFALKVRRTDQTYSIFPFYDEQLANRIAKAMVHAVELCGGGNEEPF